MATSGRTWDVAISFLWDDVDHAREIAEALGGLKVFVSPNHPEVTIGADGVEAFSQVYGRDASLVVILHREQWGSTGWTSIEKAAINSRRVNEKTDEFLLVVRMDQAPPPPWLPTSRIFGEWQPLGAKGVAGAITTRLQALGTAVRPESALDVVARMAAKKDWEGRRLQLLGRADAEQQRTAVYTALKALAETTGCHFSSDDRAASVLAGGGIFTVLAPTFNPKTGGPQFVMTHWDGELWAPSNPVGRTLGTFKYDLDAVEPDVIGWRSDREFVTSSQLAEKAVLWVLKRLETGT